MSAVLGPSSSSSSASQRTGWPRHTIPVEIFQAILNFLSRDDAKSLRLVNHEFDEKVSGHFFQSVVVPFTADIYSSNPEGGINQDGTKELASEKLCQGMRIFQSFGHHIKRFALSLELDEATLAYPPPKSTQKAVPAFWGIYRWPHDSYVRYMDLEGLEDTADDLLPLKQALKCLKTVGELALCCDSGLGYLNGLERNAAYCPGPQPVFGLRNPSYKKLQARARETMRWGPIDTAVPPAFSGKRAALAAMLVRAGVAPKQADASVDLLLRTEGVSLSQINVDGSCDLDSRSNADQSSSDTNDNEGTPTPSGGTGDNETFPLKPTRLTQAQNDMLLELDWAIRALIESYVIAIGDLSRAGQFKHLKKLTIAKIPSSQLSPFKQHVFWDHLPNLQEVSFAVQPDWRTVTKESASGPVSILISPLDGIPEVYELLSVYVGRKQNIKILHFEWICGGEFAVGANTRDRYILPAPFCSPSDMVRPNIALDHTSYISLPHVQHLSLKNCHSAPCLFMQLVRDMACQSLTTLELESFSLSFPPEHRNNVADFRNGMPKLFSWAGFMEQFTPTASVLDGKDPTSRAEAAYSFYDPADTAFLRTPSLQKEREKHIYKLQTLSFRSCGYASLPLTSFSVRDYSLLKASLKQFLQVSRNNDGGVTVSGIIAPDFDPWEASLLQGHFGMHFGWQDVYDEWFTRAAIADRGNAGQGRFSGNISIVRRETSFHPDHQPSA